MAQNTNKEKNNKLPLILSIISIVLVIISITVNILWFQFLYERSLIVQKMFLIYTPSLTINSILNIQNKANLRTHQKVSLF